MAKVKFHILMEYEKTVCEVKYDECPEENMDIMEAIAYQKENLELYGEELHDALSNSDLVKVTVEETKHYEVPSEKEVIDYQI